MALTADEVAKVALLARLKLTEEELERFTSQLTQILDYVEMLDQVDTEEIEPMAHAVERVNILRPDEPSQSLPIEEALANAPKTDGRFFLVPPILDNN